VRGGAGAAGPGGRTRRQRQRRRRSDDGNATAIDATADGAGPALVPPARAPRPSSVIRATAHAHPPAPPITVGRLFGLLCPCVRFPLLTHTVAVSSHGRALLGAAATRPSAVWRYLSILPAVRFLQQRARFIAAHDLPPHFSFAVYLRECRHHSFMTLVAIPPAAWAGLGFVCTVDLFLRSLWPGGYGTWVTPSFIVGLGSVGIILLAGALYWKMNAIHWRVMREFPGGSGGSGGAEAPAAASAVVASPPAAGKKRRRAHPHQPPPPPPSPTDLFWFRSPLLMLRLLQGVVLASALLVALVVRFWYLWSNLSTIIAPEADPWGGQTTGRVFIPILAAVAVGHSLFLLQHVVPLYIVVLHTGDVVDLQLLIESVERQRADEKRRRREERARALYYRLLEEVGPPPLRARVRAAVDSDNYRAVLTMAILVDVFFVAMLVGAWLSGGQEQAIFIAQVVLSGLILLDQGVLLYADKRRLARYWRGADRLHNAFDLVVTVAAFVSSVLEMVLLSQYINNNAGGGSDNGGGNSTATNSSLAAGWSPLSDSLPIGGGTADVPPEDVSLITALRVIRLFVVFRLPALKPDVHEAPPPPAPAAEDEGVVEDGEGTSDDGGTTTEDDTAAAAKGGAGVGAAGVAAGAVAGSSGSTTSGSSVVSGGSGGHRHTTAHATFAAAAAASEGGADAFGVGVPHAEQHRGSSGSGHGGHGNASPSAAERYYATAAAVIATAAAERDAKARRRQQQHEQAAAAAAAAGIAVADDDIVTAAASEGQLEVATDAAVAAALDGRAFTGIDSPTGSPEGSVHGGVPPPRHDGGGVGGGGGGGRHVMLTGPQAGTALRAAASAAVALRRETLASLHAAGASGGGSGPTGTPPPLHGALERMLAHGDGGDGGDVEAGPGCQQPHRRRSTRRACTGTTGCRQRARAGAVGAAARTALCRRHHYGCGAVAHAVVAAAAAALGHAARRPRAGSRYRCCCRRRTTTRAGPPAVADAGIGAVLRRRATAGRRGGRRQR
jgi:hypothetical protein